MTKPKEKTRHFKLEWNCTREELLEFFQAIKKVTTQATYCRARIGEIYLSVKGLENESNLYGEMLTNFDTAEDVLHEWRKKIRILKNLSSRPTPEKTWKVNWIDLHTAF